MNEEEKQNIIENAAGLYRLGYTFEAHELMASIGFSTKETEFILSTHWMITRNNKQQG